jgi:hypothetical protein
MRKTKRADWFQVANFIALRDLPAEWARHYESNVMNSRRLIASPEAQNAAS